jgi:hypothetical protein
LKHINPDAHTEVVTSAEEQVVLFLPVTVATEHTLADDEMAVEQTRGPFVAPAGGAVVCLATSWGAAGGVGAMAETAVAAANRLKSTVPRMFADGRCVGKNWTTSYSMTDVDRQIRGPLE